MSGKRPALRLSARRRPCGRCGRRVRVRVTLFSPSVALAAGAAAAMRALAAGYDGAVASLDAGQCCVRCTRLLRS